MKKSNKLLAGVTLALIAILAIPALYMPGNSAAPAGDIFQGMITNLKPGYENKFAGIGIYDRNCVTNQNGLTSCEAGIRTEGYGDLNFKYSHYMASEPCIFPGQNLMVEILSPEGKANVQRL